MKKILVTSIFAFMLFACSDNKDLPTIDASSEETFVQSVDGIGENLTIEQQEKFVSSMSILLLPYNGQNKGEKRIPNEQHFPDQFMKKMDGKNYLQVLAMADKLMKPQLVKRKKESKTMYEEALADFTSLLTANPELNEIKYSNPRLYIKENNEIELQADVINNTGSPIEVVSILAFITPKDAYVPSVAEMAIEFRGMLLPKSEQHITELLADFGGRKQLISDIQRNPKIHLYTTGTYTRTGKKIAYNDEYQEKLITLLEKADTYSQIGRATEWYILCTPKYMRKGYCGVK